MTTPLAINGNVFNYPEPFDEDWGTEATNWAVAVSQDLLQKTGGSFPLTAEVDFGTSFGLRAAYFGARTLAASAGLIRLANGDSIQWRNGSDTGNLVLAVDGNGKLTYESDVLITSATLASSISTLNASIAANASSLSVLNASVAANASAITVLQGSIAVVDALASNNASRLNVVEASVAALNASVAANASSITVLNASTAANASAITVLQASVGNLDLRVSALESSTAALDLRTLGVSSLVEASTIVWNLNAEPVGSVHLTNASTFLDASNLTAGRRYSLLVTQASAGTALTFGSVFVGIPVASDLLPGSGLTTVFDFVANASNLFATSVRDSVGNVYGTVFVGEATSARYA